MDKIIDNVELSKAILDIKKMLKKAAKKHPIILSGPCGTGKKQIIEDIAVEEGKKYTYVDTDYFHTGEEVRELTPMPYVNKEGNVAMAENKKIGTNTCVVVDYHNRTPMDKALWELMSLYPNFREGSSFNSDRYLFVIMDDNDGRLFQPHEHLMNSILSRCLVLDIESLLCAKLDKKINNVLSDSLN